MNRSNTTYIGLFVFVIVAGTGMELHKRRKAEQAAKPAAAAVALTPKPEPLPMGPPTELHPARAKAREKELLALARKTPDKDVAANAAIYKELHRLNWSNEKYRQKAADYDWRDWQAQVEVAEQNAANDIGKEPVRNQLDGSYPEVKEYLRREANDPSSISFIGCTNVAKVPTKGWRVGCEFRGKNAFGALVKNANWFTVRNGEVIDVQPWK